MILNIDEDSKTFKEAMSFGNSSFWKEVINDEIDSIYHDKSNMEISWSTSKDVNQ